eukprot:52824_1
MTFIGSIESVPRALPCVNCYQLLRMFVISNTIPFHKSYDLKETDLSVGKVAVEWHFINKKLLHDKLPVFFGHQCALSKDKLQPQPHEDINVQIKCLCSVIPQLQVPGRTGCACSNCCLQFYIQTNGYSSFIKMKPSNNDYKYYSALISLHGPHLHYLLLRKCSKNKKLFNNLFGFHCHRIISTRYAGYSTQHFFDFLECSNWLKFKHIEWILTSNKNVKFIIHFMRNYDKNEQFKNCVDTIFIRIRQYSIKYAVRYKKLFRKSKSSSDGLSYIHKFQWNFRHNHDFSTDQNSEYYAGFWNTGIRIHLKKCGNNNCKFGVSYNNINNTKHKWYICKGCKLIYFCSRKCQKFAWNKP